MDGAEGQKPQKNSMNVVAICATVVMVTLAIRAGGGKPHPMEERLKVVDNRQNELDTGWRQMGDRLRGMEAAQLDLKARVQKLEAEVDELGFQSVPKRIVGPGAAGSAN